MNNFEKIWAKFETHFIPKKNVTHEKAKFHSRTQHLGESISFSSALYELSERFNFANKNEEIKNRFLIGFQDKGLSELLHLATNFKVYKA